MDFLLFLYGLNFMVLAAMCMVRHASESRMVPWLWLLTFAVAGGIREWLALAAFAMVPNAQILGLRRACLLLSFLCLMEFGRVGVLVQGERRLGRWWTALVGVVTVSVWVFGDRLDPEDTIRMSAGVVSGLWAGLGLISLAATHSGPKRRQFLAVAVSLSSYGVLAGLEGFLHRLITNSPIHLNSLVLQPTAAVHAVGMVFVVLAVASIGLSVSRPAAATSPGLSVKAYSIGGRWVLLALSVVSVFGWGVTEMAGREGDAGARHNLLLRAQTVVSAINAEQVAALQGAPDDIGQSGYESLRRQLKELRNINFDCRFVYLMALRDGKVVFLADSEDENSKDYSPPGEVYEQSSAELMSLFATGEPFVEGPITDPWGSWISAHAPIWNPLSRKVEAIVGMDIDAANWKQHVAVYRLLAIVSVLTVSLLILIFFVSLEFTRRGREALRQSEQRYRTLFEEALEGILLLDYQGICMDCNQAAEQLFDAPRETLLGRRLDRFLPELQREGGSPIETGKGSPIRPVSGRPLRIESSACLYSGKSFDADVTLNSIVVGSAPALLVQVRNISEQKARQRQTVQERERLMAVLDANPVAAFMIDQKREVLFWNRACELLSHIPRELVLGKPLDVSPLLAGRARPTVAELLLDQTEAEVLKQGRRNGSLRYDSRLGLVESRDSIVVQGETRQVRVVASKVDDSSGNLLGVIQCMQDVTQEELLQSQLMHAEKMQSIGTLASGMAHEFNNILAAVRGYAQLAVLKLSSEHPAIECLHQVDVGCERAANLTQRMLAFTRAQTGKRFPVKVNDLLEGVCQLLRQTMPSGISFELGLEPGLPLVLVDANQMEQVIINLAVNARDAMPSGGSIRVCSRLVSAAQALPGVAAVDLVAPSDERYVEIGVEDNGVGIGPQDQKRIFDPFFTTKEPGKGTGLGLYIVYAVMRSHRGWVMCESEVGKGTRFRLFLPVLEDPVVEYQPPSVSEDHSELSTQGESVLVVEDEAPLRGLLEEVLTAQGYRVILAEDGLRAIEHCRSAVDTGRPFDAAVLDLAMPVMRGEDCLQQLLNLDPDLKVLLISGLLEEGPQAPVLLQARGLLRKPIQLQIFLGELKVMLAQA